MAVVLGGYAPQAFAACSTSIAGQQQGCANTGTITGISLHNATITGSIVNVGTISPNGISIDSASRINASSGAALSITGSSFSGGISNAGVISAVRSGDGSLSSSGTGVSVSMITVFSGGISNSGTISAGTVGIALRPEQSVFEGFQESMPANISSFAGNISNSGAITAQTGIAVGANVTFAPGAAIINSGTITGSVAAIDASNASSAVTIKQTGGLISGAILLSSYADQLNISGGTIAGNIVGRGSGNTINFTLGSGVFTYGSAYSFTGINQVNVNSGLVVLDGINSATNVTVNGGTLRIGDAANTNAMLSSTNGINVYGTLAGHGTVSGNVAIANAGTLSPGGSIGTLTINGNLTFSQGGIYAVQTSSTQASNTAVNGNVTLARAGVTAYVTPTQYGLFPGSQGQTYKILTSSNPLGSGNAFNSSVSVASNSLTVAQQLSVLGSASLSYDAYNVYITLPSYAVEVQLPTNAPDNAQNIAGAINSSILSGNSVSSGVQNLASLSGDALNAAVIQLGGQPGGVSVTNGFNAGGNIVNTSLDPTVDGRDTSSDSSSQPCNTASADAGSSTALAYAPADSVTARANAAFQALWPRPARPVSRPQFTLWGASYGGVGSITGNAATGAASTQSQVYGIVTGLDDHIAPATVIGFALGGGGTSWQLSQGLGSGHSGMAQASIYGMQHYEPLYVAGALAYSWQGVSTSRTVTLAGFDTLDANFGANVLSARLETGLRLPSDLLIASHLPPNAAITPYGAVQPQVMFVPGYGEYAATGSNQFALSYASQTHSTIRTELGTWFDTDLAFTALSFAQAGALKAYGRIAWAHDFNNESTSVAFFQQLPGSSFLINTAKPAANSALVTSGLEYRLADGWSVLAKFDGEYSPTTSIYAGTGAIKKVW